MAEHHPVHSDKWLQCSYPYREYLTSNTHIETCVQSNVMRTRENAVKVSVIDIDYEYGLADYGHVYGDFSRVCYITLYTAFLRRYWRSDTLVIMYPCFYSSYTNDKKLLIIIMKT